MPGSDRDQECAAERCLITLGLSRVSGVVSDGLGPYISGQDFLSERWPLEGIRSDPRLWLIGWSRNSSRAIRLAKTLFCWIRGAARGIYSGGIEIGPARVRRYKIFGIDSDPALLSQAADRIGAVPSVTLIEADFLRPRDEKFDYIIGNPPYVSITGLSIAEREHYRRHFLTAVGRFDLYALFFEQALRLLKPHGRLVFITREKFIYVESAARLREQLALAGVEGIEFLEESTFRDLVTYPVITTLTRSQGAPEDPQVTLRNGHSRAVRLPMLVDPGCPLFSDPLSHDSPHTLIDAFTNPLWCGHRR